MDTTQIQTAVALLLPVPIALIAGILRQDKFPDIANEIISQAIIFLVALGSFFFGVGGHFTGNAQVDFLALVAYCGWLSNTAPFKPLHSYLQGNLLSLGNAKVSQVETVALSDVMKAVTDLQAWLQASGVAVVQPPVQQQVPRPPMPSQGVPRPPLSSLRTELTPTGPMPLLPFSPSSLPREPQQAAEQTQVQANPDFGVMPVNQAQFVSSPQSSYPLAALGRTPQPPKG